MVGAVEGWAARPTTVGTEGGMRAPQLVTCGLVLASVAWRFVDGGDE